MQSLNKSLCRLNVLKRKRGIILIIAIRNVLVILAIVLWLFIGVCYFSVYLKNKLSNGHSKVNNTTHKDITVQSNNNKDNSNLCL